MANEKRQTIGCVKQHDCKNFSVKCSECFAMADIRNHHPCYEHRDLVEVVRCKDCEFCAYNSSNDTYKCCSMNGMYRRVEPDEFCSYGERRTENG